MAFDEDFELVFTGIDRDDEADRIAKAKDSATTFMTIDEVRGTFGMAPLPEKKGEMILHAIWQQHAQVLDAQAQEGEGGEEEPEEGGAGFSDADLEDLFGDTNEEPEEPKEEPKEPKEPKEEKPEGLAASLGPSDKFFYEL